MHKMIIGTLFLILLFPIYTNSIDVISSYINDIDNKPLVRNEVEIQPQTTEGGSLFYYTFKEEIVKIELDYYGEMGQVNHRFYLKGSNLIFIEYVLWEYNMPMYITEENHESSGFKDYFSFEQSKKYIDSYFFNKEGSLIDSKIESKDNYEISYFIDLYKEIMGSISR